MKITCAVRRRVAEFLVTLSLMLCAGPQAALADDQPVVRIGGTGIALAAMRKLGESLGATDPSIRVDVLPSLGTPGGIRALVAGELDIALAARDLTPQEQAKGAKEAACFKTALVFSTSGRNPPSVSKSDLPKIYSDANSSWPDGSPLKVILRSRAGSENPYISAAIPGMAVALDKAYARPGMPVGSTDQENANLALRIQGSFSLMSLLQLQAEELNLRVVPLDGVVATAETLADNSYPMPLRVCAVTLAAPPPAAAKYLAHLQSAKGQALLRSFGSIWSK